MAKLSIGIGVDLGNSIQGINSLISTLDTLNKQVSALSTNLNSIKNIKANPTVTVTTKNVNQNSVINSSTGNITQPALKPIPDIFVEYRRGMTEASSVTDFLKSKQTQLQNQISQLQAIAGRATGLKAYEAALNSIGQKQKQLESVNKALVNVGNGAQGFTRLSGAANQANMVLTNVGRIAQDSAYGILGISNNINPLVESFSQLRQSAKASGTSISSELLKSLTGPGGLTLAFSAVTAALSFASVGLSYWTRNINKARDDQQKFNDELAKATSSAFSTGNQLSTLVEQAKSYARGSQEQAIALNEINKLLGEHTQKITEDNLYSEQSIEIIKNKTRALIAEQEAQFLSNKAGEAGAKRRVLDLRNQELATTAGIGKTASALNKLFEQSKTNKEAKIAFDNIINGVTQTDRILSAFGVSVIDIFGSDKQKAAIEYAKNLQEISKLDEDFNKFSAAAVNSSNAIKTFNIGDKSAVQILKDKIELLTTSRAALVSPNTTDKQKWQDYTNQITKLQAELDKLQGKPIRTPRISKQETFTSALKQLKIDLKAIQETPTLNLFEKDIKSAKVLETGLLNIREKFSKEASTSIEIKNLDLLQSQLEFKNFGKGIFDNLSKAETSINTLKETATIFDEPEIKRERTIIINSLQELYKKRDELSKIPIVTVNGKSSLAEFEVTNRQINILIQEWVDKLKNVEFRQANEEIRSVLKDAQGAINKIGEKEIGFGKLLSRDKANIAFKAIEEIGKIKGNDAGVAFATLFLRAYGQKMADRAAIEEPIQAIKDELQKKGFVVPLKPKWNKEDWEKYSSNVESQFEAIKEIVNGSVDALGNAFQNAFSGKKDIAGRFFADLLSVIGKAAMDFGKKALLLSTAWNTLRQVLFTPAGPVAAIGLIAVGAALMALSKSMAEKRGYATGGFVRGKGTSTSDSIPAMLSDREYVIKASSVSKYGVGFLDALNSGALNAKSFKGFAEGGLVTSGTDIVNLEEEMRTNWRAIVNRSLSMPNTRINGSSLSLGSSFGQSTGYIAETKISGQDLKLVLTRADRRFNNVT